MPTTTTNAATEKAAVKDAWLAVAGAKARSIDRAQLREILCFVGFNPTEEFLRTARRRLDAASPASVTGDKASSRTARNTEYSYDDVLRLCGCTGPDNVEQQDLIACPITKGADLVQAFRALDANGDGKLSRKELVDVLTKRGETMGRDEVEEALLMFDENGDGYIDADEFTKMVEEFSMQMRRMKPPAAAAARDNQDGDEMPTAMPADKDDVVDIPPVKQWHPQRSFGCLQVFHNLIKSEAFAFTVQKETDVFLELRLDKHRVLSTADVSLFLLQCRDTMFEFRDLEDLAAPCQVLDYSFTHIDKPCRLRRVLKPGRYLVLPYSTGTRLHQRRKQPTRSKPACNMAENGKVSLSAEAVAAIDNILFGRPSLTKREFELLAARIQNHGTTHKGEAVIDAAIHGFRWQELLDEHDAEDANLTRRGLISFFKKVASSMQGSSEALVTSMFEPLGFSRQLVQDEAVNFKLFAFASQAKAISDIRPYWPAAATYKSLFETSLKLDAHSQDISLRDIAGDGPMSGSAQVAIVRDPSRVVVLLRNKAERDMTVSIDLSSSVNAITNPENPRRQLTVPTRGTVLAFLAVADNLGQPWRVACSAQIVS